MMWRWGRTRRAGDVPPARASGATRQLGPRPLGFPNLERGIQVFVALSLGLFAALAILPSERRPISDLFLSHDAPWLAVICCGLLLLPRIGGSRRIGDAVDAAAARPVLVVAVLVLAVILVGIVGTYVVTHDYALSLDEFMARSDAGTIARGRLIQPVAEAWRPYVPALEPFFRLSVRDNAGLVSSYLPVNAAIQAGFALAGDPALAGPVLAGVAVAALVAIARRLWPTRPDAALLAGLMVATSPQVLVTAMTPYAMTGHLALNLVWLWLFLVDTRWTRIGALVIGFLATGLHQLAFHPVFAAPFILWLVVSRRFAVAAFYVIGYALILAFWIAYWPLVLRAAGMEGMGAGGASAIADKLVELVATFQAGGAGLMAKNLVRFLTWQNPILPVLAIVGLSRTRRDDPVMICAAAGVVLTLLMVFVLLPFQGHGWGYRYLHGLIGSLALVATHGYVALTDGAAAEARRRTVTRTIAATGFTLAILLPARAMEANALITPFARAEALIRHADGDVVFVDADGLLYARDLVRNDPRLRPPLVFDLWSLDEGQVRALCAAHDVAVFDRRDGEALGFPLISPLYVGPDARLRRIMTSIGCGHPIHRAADK